MHLDYGAFASLGQDALLAGGNLVAVGDAATGFELLQFRDVQLLAANTYRLSGLLRGLGGSSAEMLPLRLAGARVVLLNSAVVQPELTLDEATRASAWRVGPSQHDHGHSTYVALTLPPVVKALRPLPPVQLDGMPMLKV